MKGSLRRLGSRQEAGPRRLLGWPDQEAAARAGTQVYNERPLFQGAGGLGARGNSRRREKPQAAAAWEPTGRALAPHGPGMGWAGRGDPDACGIEGGDGRGGDIEKAEVVR